jgi:signal transduction histidine kinase/CheY-like chemotaxis protein
MFRDDALLGVIVIWRREVRPFSRQQTRLLETFGNQAVIAIENVRLFQQLNTRNRELTDALEQQTATSEVLKVISRSSFDLDAVLQTLIEYATRLCSAEQGFIFRRDDDGYRLAVAYHAAPEFTEWPRAAAIRPGDGTIVGRVALEGRTVQIIDAQCDCEWPGALRDAGGISEVIRTLLGVPLLREGVPIGVRPFTNKQIELTTTFADQAVIAIENVRLFDGIRDKSRQLELANTYKSRFLAAASHDLRQPLHALNLFVAQLPAAVDPTERNRLVAQIDAAVSAMNELFDALLDMSKLDAGVLKPNVSEFSVEHLLRRMEMTFAEAAREKGLRFTVVSSGAWVRSDLILLERILLNLISNAVRYTSRGGVVIGCRRRGERLRIDVWDSGSGIPDNQKQNIFGEFYRLAADEPDHRGGLGLGLSIVDRLGRLLDHPVELASAPGKGSRFSVLVPLTASGGISEEAPTAPPMMTDPASGKLIVVIDDDALVLDGMRGILRSWGCSVVTAISDTAALEQLKQLDRYPDLIISDYRLGDGKNGIEAIECLRRALGIPVPAFLISGDTAPERLRDATASNYRLLHKPVAPMTLRAMVNRLLKNRDGLGDTVQITSPMPIQSHASAGNPARRRR